MPMLDHDVPLYYTEAGTGEPILFCHGAGGNAASWFNQFGEFAKDYRCIAYDCRGFGRSTCTAEQLRVGEFAADALAVLDALAIDSAHFVCQSMGGWAGVRVALDHPERIRKLVLSDTIGGIALPSGIESLASVGKRVADARLKVAAIAASYPRKNPAGAFLYGQLSDFNRLPDVALGKALLADAALVPVERARRLRLPILIFSGTDDVLWPPAVLAELAATLPTAERFEIDSGHSPYFENPRVFNQVLREFLGRP